MAENQSEIEQSLELCKVFGATTAGKILFFYDEHRTSESRVKWVHGMYIEFMSANCFSFGSFIVFYISKLRWTRNRVYFWIQIHYLRMVQLHWVIMISQKMEICLRILSVRRDRIGIQSKYAMSILVKTLHRKVYRHVHDIKTSF